MTETPDRQPPALPALTFGVNLGRGSAAGTAAAAKDAERRGFDVVTAADHWNSEDPFLMLTTAAAVTERIRLRTYVLDIGFWQPALLARTVSTLDALSGGRVDLGLGAGHMQHEHEAVGLPFPPHAARIEALEGAVAQVRRRLADPEHRPAAVQRPVPVLIGAMSGAGLDLAAREAEVVALSGLLPVPDEQAGTFTVASSEQTDERVAGVRAIAAERPGGPPVLDALLQQVVIDRPPEQAAEEFAAVAGGRISAADLLDTPFVLYAASAADAARELQRRAARWGITSWCTHTASGPALADVMAAARAMAASGA